VLDHWGAPHKSDSSWKGCKASRIRGALVINFPQGIYLINFAEGGSVFVAKGGSIYFSVKELSLLVLPCRLILVGSLSPSVRRETLPSPPWINVLETSIVSFINNGKEKAVARQQLSAPLLF
jgi:hypothetical protein